MTWGRVARIALLRLPACVLVLAAWLLLVVAPRVVFAQDVPDPGPSSGGGVDMGPLLGGLSGLRDAIGGAIRDGIRQLLDALLYTLGLIPRLGVMAFLMAIGVFARALIEGFGLTELGSILIQVPLGPLQEGWVQVLVLDTKGVAFLLLPVAFGIRAFRIWITMTAQPSIVAIRTAATTRSRSSSPRSSFDRPTFQLNARMPNAAGSSRKATPLVSRTSTCTHPSCSGPTGT